MRAKDIRRGAVILYNGQPYRVIEFQHVAPGNWRAMVQTKLRNIITGSQTEHRFSSAEDIPEADVYSFKAQYLYQDASGYHFMNSSNYEEVALSAELLGDGVYYLQEQMEVGITTYNEQPVGIELPATVVLTIAETEPEVRGATASNSPKPAKTDTGLQLSVPPFIKQGERIVVNTLEGTYVGRAE